jgi:hypothetical protein
MTVLGIASKKERKWTQKNRASQGKEYSRGYKFQLSLARFDFGNQHRRAYLKIESQIIFTFTQ